MLHMYFSVIRICPLFTTPGPLGHILYFAAIEISCITLFAANTKV